MRPRRTPSRGTPPDVARDAAERLASALLLDEITFPDWPSRLVDIPAPRTTRRGGVLWLSLDYGRWQVSLAFDNGTVAYRRTGRGRPEMATIAEAVREVMAEAEAGGAGP